MHLRRELEEAMTPPTAFNHDTSPPAQLPPLRSPKEKGEGPHIKAKAVTAEEGAVGAGNASNYDFKSGDLPLRQPTPLPENFEDARKIAPSEYAESAYGDDLDALFREEDDIMSMHVDMESSGSHLTVHDGVSSDGASNAWISDEEQDEDDLLYATYDIGIDVMDVDEPTTLERAFDPGNDFFGDKG
jgi:hypothetical protein